MKCKNQECKANAINNSDYCFMHDPSQKSKHIESARKGGAVGKKKDLVKLEPVDLSEKGSVIKLLNDTINYIRSIKPDGLMDVKTANCVGFLASKILEARKTEVKPNDENQYTGTEEQNREIDNECLRRTKELIAEGKINKDDL